MGLDEVTEVEPPFPHGGIGCPYKGDEVTRALSLCHLRLSKRETRERALNLQSKKLDQELNGPITLMLDVSASRTARNTFLFNYPVYGSSVVAA